jgi:MFS family permease
MYVALYNGIIGISAAIAPLAGGVIADYTSIRLVLLLSWLLRSTGWLLISYTVRPPAGRRIRPADLLPNSLRSHHKKVAKR